jgi:glucosamine--fructose-6-phosphate aminotransferase (isomerizing)
VSQSGETKDVHRALEVAQTEGTPIFSVVNTVGSLIARTTRCGVYLMAGRCAAAPARPHCIAHLTAPRLSLCSENAVASTKAFTTQVCAMAMVASWFSERREQQPSLVRAVCVAQRPCSAPTARARAGAGGARRLSAPPAHLHRRVPAARAPAVWEPLCRSLGGTAGMTLRTHEQMKKIAAKMKAATSCFVLGKGYAHAIALEGALKIKARARLTLFTPSPDPPAAPRRRSRTSTQRATRAAPSSTAPSRCWTRASQSS